MYSRPVRTAGLALLAVLALVAAGCGGGGGAATGGGSVPEGAKLVAADTPAFVSVAANFDGQQWRNGQALLQKFPSHDKLIRKITSGLAEQQLDFERDVKPAFGNEVDVAFYDLQADQPTVVGMTQPRDEAKLEALLAKSKDTTFVTRLHDNTAYFRQQLTARGVAVRQGIHPIVPIIIGDTAKAIAISAELLKRGIYVSGFGFPVVPQGAARLRCQISAAHTREHLDRAIEAIVDVGQEFGVVGNASA